MQRVHGRVCVVGSGDSAAFGHSRVWNSVGRLFLFFNNRPGRVPFLGIINLINLGLIYYFEKLEPTSIF
jgi:hypothetical protein